MLLHIDIETYSSTDIKKCGMYKYAESIDFDISLFAYAFNNETVRVVDLASGEQIPPRVLSALTDSSVKKLAHNAAFERICLASYGIQIPVNQFICTAVLAARYGLPRSLADVSQELGLEAEGKGKMTEGKKLIAMFGVPVKGRRIAPEERIEKWQLFKEYCKQDVEAERAVWNTVKKYAACDLDDRLYQLDQKINDRGVLIDTAFCECCISLDLAQSKRVLQEMQDITHLTNPNSTVQLKKWLGARLGKEVTSLAKGELKGLAAGADAQTKRVLELRAQAGKTSIAKYEAMLNMAGWDDRVRGLFLFYGAKTGRWAARGLQPHNMPRNYLSDLNAARDSVNRLDLSGYDNRASVLSQLIRTAFIAQK